MISIKVLKPKAIIAFMLASLLTLTIANSAFALLYGFSSSMLKAMGGLSKEVLIIQEGAKSIHTSWVPLSLAESLNKLPNVKAKPFTLTPSIVNGQPVIVRGLSILFDYENKIIEGALPKEDGAWILFGEKAYKKLRLKIGDIIAIGSPKNPSLIFLIVAGVYKLGDLRDYEAVVPLNLGLALAGLPKGFVSAIQVEGIKKEALKKLLEKPYKIEIIHEAIDGQLTILDALSLPIASISLKDSKPKKLELPFGYYTFIYQASGLASNITSLLLTKDQTLNLSLKKGLFKLKAILPASVNPALISESGKEIKGFWVGDSWLFNVSQGAYILKLKNSSFKILIQGDSIFNPAFAENQQSLKVKVLWRDGTEASNYIISIKNLNGELVFGAESHTSTITIPLPAGEYEIEVSKPPYLAKAHVNVPSKEIISITLSGLSNPSKIPLEAFKRLKPSSPIEASIMALSMLIGLAASMLLALTIALTILSAFALFAIYKALYSFAKENLKLLWMLNAESSFIFKTVTMPILALSLTLSLLSSILAFILHESLNLSILGYGALTLFQFIFAYSTLLALTSWLSFQAEINKSIKEGFMH